jgi:hypothetical protein
MLKYISPALYQDTENILLEKNISLIGHFRILHKLYNWSQLFIDIQKLKCRTSN